MTDDLEYLIDRLERQAGTNQCVVVLDGKCCKIAREDYFPDNDGIVTFHKKISWVEEGFSTAEMLEFLKKYSDRISCVKFEAVDGSVWSPLNVYESDSIGDSLEFSCFIIVGDPDSVLTVYGNPQNENWMTSSRNLRGYV